MSNSNDDPTRSSQSTTPDRQLSPALIGLIGTIILAGCSLAGIILTQFGCYLTNSCPPPPTALPTKVPITSKFPFETGIMGWVAERSATDSLGCIGVSPSSSNPDSPNPHDGTASLMMNMDLSGGDTHQSKGEAWIDLRMDDRFKTPQNLTNHTITIWVYAPQDSLGEQDLPNGVQVFVKDDNWLGEYGTWTNISEGRWMPVTLTISASPPPNGDMKQGFNPEHIIAIGIKMGTGEDGKTGKHSTATYRGPIYIDAIDWN